MILTWLGVQWSLHSGKMQNSVISRLPHSGKQWIPKSSYGCLWALLQVSLGPTLARQAPMMRSIFVYWQYNALDPVIALLPFHRRGCSSMSEHPLCMQKVRGSFPNISMWVIMSETLVCIDNTYLNRPMDIFNTEKISFKLVIWYWYQIVIWIGNCW